MLGGRIRRAAENTSLAAHQGYLLISKANAIVDRAEEQGFIEVEVDITDNPWLEQLGIGKDPIKLKIKLP